MQAKPQAINIDRRFAVVGAYPKAPVGATWVLGHGPNLVLPPATQRQSECPCRV